MQRLKNLFYALLLVVLGNECAFSQTAFVKFGSGYDVFSKAITDYVGLGGSLNAEYRPFAKASILLNVGFAKRLNEPSVLSRRYYYLTKNAAISAEFRYYFSKKPSSFYVGLCPTYYAFFSQRLNLSNIQDDRRDFYAVSGKFGYKYALSKVFALELNAVGGFYATEVDDVFSKKYAESVSSLNLMLSCAL